MASTCRATQRRRGQEVQTLYVFFISDSSDGKYRLSNTFKAFNVISSIVTHSIILDHKCRPCHKFYFITVVGSIDRPLVKSTIFRISAPGSGPKGPLNTLGRVRSHPAQSTCGVLLASLQRGKLLAHRGESTSQGRDLIRTEPRYSTFWLPSCFY